LPRRPKAARDWTGAEAMGGTVMRIKHGVLGAAILTLCVGVVVPPQGGLQAHAAESPPPKAGDKPAGDDKAPYGSADFYPSSARPIGWRGDGTGHYPGATPPTTWSRTEKGEKKNILWETKLPCYSWATPIVVGDKVFTRSEPYDLICLNKNTGKLLWIRSHPPFIAVTAEEKKATPAFNEIEPLVVELQRINDAFVAQGWTKELYRQKYDLQKKIDTLTATADKKYKLPADYYVESWTGYTAATPCSDGQNVYLTSGSGITACYDLNGSRKWARYESVVPAWGEHGKGCSPTLIGDRFLVMTLSLLALNKQTGEVLWTSPAKTWDAYSIQPLKIGDIDYVILGGNYVRVGDGNVVIPRVGDMPSGMVVANQNMVYFGGGHSSFYRCEPKPGGGLLSKPLVQEEYNRVKLPVGANPAFTFKINETIASFYTASPLFHDNLLYYVANAGRLAVIDTQKTKQADTLVYTAFPAFDFKNGFGRKSPGMGIGASPALAGKYIYMLDSTNCMIVMEPGREYKELAKNTIDYTVPEGWEQKHWMGPHHEQTEASPVFDGSRIYIRGEQFLYCVGER
jgi:hypothetical protein